MTSMPQLPIDPRDTLPPPAPTGELTQKNVELIREIERLRHECAVLRDAAREAQLGNDTAREMRRAALNLMEDAVEARRAERRENDERRRVEEELREADRRKDEFLATLAHELRGPLAPVRNSLHVLRLPGTDPATARALHDVIERQVAHMARLVEDLMEVSRITRGRIELRRERVDLAAIVQSAIETARPLLQSAGHRLDVQLPPATVWLDVDPVRMGQVLSNLLSNAAKYTDDGGRITIAATCEDSSWVRLSVRDTGIGIPPEMLAKVFDLFTQVDRAYDRAQGGLGIGLTLARSLVQMHGGTIKALSEGPGRGTEVVVTLPITDREGVTPEVKGPPVPQIARRVLVVDDNEDSAETMALLLQSLGAEVRTANDGLTALEALRQHAPSVVILDIGMPRMDGYEVARRARQTPEGRAAMLIALTGWGQEEDRRRTQEAGFDHHLVKPVDLAALRALLADSPGERGRSPQS
jgi:signal transduction histidine kinase/ActR/RegA family two-component response regulator